MLLLIGCAPKVEKKAPSMAPGAPGQQAPPVAQPPTAPVVQAPPGAAIAGVQDADIEVGSPESEQDPLSLEDVPTTS